MDERHRVLIADSYPDEAEQLKKELSGKYNVISVRDNGVDTLDDIIKLKPDLVVIDLMLSEIDGIGVIEKCRELIYTPKKYLLKYKTLKAIIRIAAIMYAMTFFIRFFRFFSFLSLLIRSLPTVISLKLNIDCIIEIRFRKVQI